MTFLWQLWGVPNRFFRISNRPLSDCVRTKLGLRGKNLAFFFACTKEIANLSSQPRLCFFFVFAKFKSGLLDLFEVQDSGFEGSQI